MCAFSVSPDAVRCAAHGPGYPVAVLPTSHLVLDEADAGDTFTGMNARFASRANLLVPTAYLNDALHTVPRIARLADATGMSLLHTVLTVVPDKTVARPDGPFLAAEVDVDAGQTRVNVSQDRLKTRRR